MPFLDIAISQPCSCFRNNILTFRSESRFHSNLVIENDRRLTSVFPWKTRRITEKEAKRFNFGRIEVCLGGLTIKAVSTLEITNIACKNDEVNRYQNILRMDINSIRSSSHVCELQYSGEDSTEVGDREMLRRTRISKANKGNMPWNKGRKHSPETLQRIKERTRIAMQDPKVKMKLVKFGHAQSEETKIKIGVGVRLGWERRREKLMLQETCYHEWQNLISAASRKGLLGEEELQWDSYKVLNEQYVKEWIQSVEQRKKMSRPKGSKRAPKSAEQKRKIAAAIAAKWADPDYRDRVCSGLAKYHGIPEGVERKPKRKLGDDGETRKTSPKKKDKIDDLAIRENKNQNQRIRLKKSNTPFYKDPFASSKLEMLKNIRAQRVAAINKNIEAISRAKLLISEAEKAANSLEIAAKHSPFAQSSLLESRALISEAVQFIKMIESEDPVWFDLSDTTTEPVHHAEEEINADVHNLDDGSRRKVNGVQNLLSTDNDMDYGSHVKVNGVQSLSSVNVEADNLHFNTVFLPDLVNRNGSNSSPDDSLKTGEKASQMSSNGYLSQEPNGIINHVDFTKNLSDRKQTTISQEPNGIINHVDFTKNFSDGKQTTNGTVNHSQIPILNGMAKNLQCVKPEASQSQVKITKKWICGRLVEVLEETEET